VKIANANDLRKFTECEEHCIPQLFYAVAVELWHFNTL